MSPAATSPHSRPHQSGALMYDVKESGIELRHAPQPATPRDGTEFLERIRSNFELHVLERPNPNELVFEIIGVDVSFANALRRIMLSEVPTMAIEHIYMWNNSSIVHDEVLAHRLGLIPLNIDPRLFDDFLGDDDEATDRNTIVFRLGVSCGKSKADDERKDKQTKKAKQLQSRRGAAGENGENDEGGDGAGDDSILGNADADRAASEAVSSAAAAAIETPGRPYTKHVYSRDLEFVPQGNQADRFPDGGIRPVHEDILLAKLRPGQLIELEAHARRGVGRDHAKFSPVATAAYRLMPVVELVQPVYDDLADELANLYEPGVFKVVPCGPEDELGRDRKAVVCNSYACTMSRNYMRNPILKKAVKISRKSDHFIFSVESVGMMAPGVILAEALRILQAKCHNVIRMADESLEVEGLE